MKLIILPLIIVFASLTAVAQSQQATQAVRRVAPPPPPPPPPRNKAQANQWDKKLLKKQSDEILQLRQEIEKLKKENAQLQAQTKGQNSSVQIAPTQAPVVAKKPLKTKPVPQKVEPAIVKKTVEPVKVQKAKSVVKEKPQSIKPKVKKQAQKKPKAKKRKPSSVAFKSGMNKFKKSCSMFSKPNKESSKVGSVKAGRKLWIDSHNSDWRKAYKKSGTVYVHRDCF